MILLHLPLDRGGIIWEWIWNTDEIRRWLKKKKKEEGGGEINFRGKGLAHLMNSCSFSLTRSIFPSLFLCKDEKDEKKNPSHSDRWGGALRAINHQSVIESACPAAGGCSSLLTDFQCGNGCEA